MDLVYHQILQAKEKGEKRFVVLIDPDQLKLAHVERILSLAEAVDFFFVGGSLVLQDRLDQCLRLVKESCNKPIILFPGSIQQIHSAADAILLLSLISGRNPELLIGQHVIAAPMLRASGLEILPTGYMLIDGGAPTTASYISNSQPIPANKSDIALCTALAGELMGLKLIYLDAGSGAKQQVPAPMIQAVSQAIRIPMIVGGGIRTPEKAHAAANAGADVIVVGNAIEKDPGLLQEMAAAVRG